VGRSSCRHIRPRATAAPRRYRLHSTPGYRSPAESETDHYETIKNVTCHSYQPSVKSEATPDFMEAVTWSLDPYSSLAPAAC
jgi:hypothetical protein